MCGSLLYVLQLEVPKVVKSLNKQLREKSVKTKVRIIFGNSTIIFFCLLAVTQPTFFVSNLHLTCTKVKSYFISTLKSGLHS
jgi:hypothetical protein